MSAWFVIHRPTANVLAEAATARAAGGVVDSYVRLNPGTEGEWDIVPMFACRPCECGGMCDKCRQNEGERVDAGTPSTTSPMGGANQSLSVCLCDPDTDAVCDRTCDRCPECGSVDHHFDRSLCGMCGSMHYYCDGCGRQLDGCDL